MKISAKITSHDAEPVVAPNDKMNYSEGSKVTVIDIRYEDNTTFYLCVDKKGQSGLIHIDDLTLELGK